MSQVFFEKYLEGFQLGTFSTEDVKNAVKLGRLAQEECDSIFDSNIHSCRRAAGKALSQAIAQAYELQFHDLYNFSELIAEGDTMAINFQKQQSNLRKRYTVLIDSSDDPAQINLLVQEASQEVTLIRLSN